VSEFDCHLIAECFTRFALLILAVMNFLFSVAYVLLNLAQQTTPL
jgi:hypothetical protein